MIEKARRFASKAHAAIDQRRRYTHEPYIVHPAAVAQLVAGVTDDEATICAAWLHDVVEDTPVTLDEIALEFGTDVAGLVFELTDVSTATDSDRQSRKQRDLQHVAAASPRAKTIKLADMIDNTRSIVQRDPTFASTYMAEKRRLLQVLREGDRKLYSIAREIIEAYFDSR